MNTEQLRFRHPAKRQVLRVSVQSTAVVVPSLAWDPKNVSIPFNVVLDHVYYGVPSRVFPLVYLLVGVIVVAYFLILPLVYWQLDSIVKTKIE